MTKLYEIRKDLETYRKSTADQLREEIAGLRRHRQVDRGRDHRPDHVRRHHVIGPGIRRDDPVQRQHRLRRSANRHAALAPLHNPANLAGIRAGREIFMQDPGHPVCSALVKEFGVYPPGCFVTLASGETGVVIKRGSTVMSPIVALLCLLSVAVALG